jgi:IS6 family transposase
MRTRRPRPAPATRSAFAGFRFPPDVIVLAVRWYLRFGLSYRDVEELLAERGIEADHVTIYRWVQRFTPQLAEAARPTGTLSEIDGSSRRGIAPSRTPTIGSRPIMAG